MKTGKVSSNIRAVTLDYNMAIFVYRVNILSFVL